MQSNAQGCNVPKFTLKTWVTLISGLFEVKRLSKFYNGAEITKILCLCLYFYTVGSLSYFDKWIRPKKYLFSNHLYMPSSIRTFNLITRVIILLLILLPDDWEKKMTLRMRLVSVNKSNKHHLTSQLDPRGIFAFWKTDWLHIKSNKMLLNCFFPSMVLFCYSKK